MMVSHMPTMTATTYTAIVCKHTSTQVHNTAPFHMLCCSWYLCVCHERSGGFGMTPWCTVLVCSWRRVLADRHLLPFPWTLSGGGGSLRLTHSPNRQQFKKALHWTALQFLTIVVLHVLMFSALALRNEAMLAGRAGLYTPNKN